MKYKLSLLIITSLMVACSKDSDYSSFTNAIESGGDFASISYSEEITEIGETETREGDEIWTCRSELVSIEDALGGQNGFSLFSPNANVVFPGNLIQGKSLYKATPDEILAERGGGEITISILDGADNSSIYVDEITLGNVTLASNEILAEKDENSVIPSNFQFNKSIVQSERELAFRMKADYENAWASVSGSLSFSSSSSFSRMLVTLDQTFYTLSFTAPPRIDDFFSETAEPQDLERFIGPDNPPCYISSVNYGRIFYMLVESSESESQLSAAVNASFEGLTQEGSGEIEIDAFESFDEVNIKIFALGGDASTTIEAGGLSKNNLHKLNDILKRATDIRTAVPISYKVQSVKTNQLVSVQLATDYERKTCTVTSALPPPAATEHWSGIIELLGGPVCAMVRMDAVELFENGDLPTIFVDSTGLRCILDFKGELFGPYAHPRELFIEHGFGDLPDFPIDGIGAGGTILIPKGHGQFDKTHVWVNKRGNRYMSGWFFDDHGYRVSSGLIGDFEQISHFETEGVSALCDYYSIGVITVNKQGTRLKLTPHIDIATSQESDTNQLTGGPDSNKFPDGVSAITRLDDFVFASVDKSGRRYMVVDFEDAGNIKYFGPFKL